jgi:hypothetical protein
MWKQAFAGALMLATVGSLSVTANGISVSPAAAQDVVVTESHIARLKSALHLTPQQLVYWHAVEATLRSAASRQQAVSDENVGFVQRVRNRVGSFVLNAASIQRVTAASRPLVASLDDDQRRDGMNAIQQMGLASLF